MIRKKIFGLLLCTISIAGWSQEFKDVMRYEYTMTYKPGTEKDTLIEDTVFLDVWENNSRFATAERVKFIEFIADDNNQMWRLETVDPPNMKHGQNWIIERKEKDNYYLTKVGSTFLKTKESLDLINWNILSELSDYEGMEVQKAIGDYKGRSWTVWFTKEIPLLEGPYKFKNLPGFVVKATSADGDYLFEFIKSEKTQTVLKYHNYEVASVIKETKLKKAREINANKSLKQIYDEQGVTVVEENNPDFEKEYNKRIGDSNNYIEKL